MSIMLRWGDKALGWVEWRDVLRNAVSLGLDYLVVEGVMGLLTGSSRDSKDGFSSTIGFVNQVNTDIVLIASATYDGVEGAIFRLRSYIKELIKINRKPMIVVLNNVYHGIHEDDEVVRFRRELEGLSIRLITIDTIPISSKPEELIDLGDYEEAAVKISKESLCKYLIESLSVS
jgi:hypothetical protein